MIRVVAENGVVYYRSKLIPCPHGFSTRIGGVSSLPYTESLNLGFGRGDGDNIVLENLALFADAIGVSHNSFVYADQIHSSIVKKVTKNYSADACDGLVTYEKGVTLGIKTADCVPILLFYSGNEKKEAIVSAVHAGWRGTCGNIACAAVAEMVDMGAKVDEIKVAIGPSIKSCCYEVAKDFYDKFCDSLGENVAKQFITVKDKEERFVADIVGINRHLLENCGVLTENIDVANICTYCNPEEFYSHRYLGNQRGTMLSAIAIN